MHPKERETICFLYIKVSFKEDLSTKSKKFLFSKLPAINDSRELRNFPTHILIKFSFLGTSVDSATFNKTEYTVHCLFGYHNYQDATF